MLSLIRRICATLTRRPAERPAVLRDELGVFTDVRDTWDGVGDADQVL